MKANHYSTWIVCEDCGEEFWGKSAKLCLACKQKRTDKRRKRVRS
jgi:ribosomal protein L37E